MSTQEAVDKALVEYWDELRKYTLPHGRPGYDMFDTIEELVKRDSHLIAEVVDRELSKDKEDGDAMAEIRRVSTNTCNICGRTVDSINYESHMGVMHSKPTPVQDPENGWWDGDWSSLEAAIRGVIRNEVTAMLYEDQAAAVKKYMDPDLKIFGNG